MALKKRSTSTSTVGGPGSKAYFWRSLEYGNGMSQWRYVTADASTTVEVSGYLDDDELKAMMAAGDELVVYQVAAISDDRTIQEDIASGLVDITFHYVVASDGSGVNITPDVLAATITYTS